MELEGKQSARGSLLRRKWPIIIGGIVLAIIFTIATLCTHGAPKASYQQSGVSVDAPFEIRLNQRLLNIPLEEIVILPYVEGEWVVSRSIAKGDTLRFVQDESFAPDTDYTVTFKDVRRVTGIEVGLPKVSFATESAPDVLSATFAEGATIAADADLGVTLSAKNRGLRDLELRTSPESSFNMSVRDDKIFTWSPTGLLPQGQELVVEVVDKKSGGTLVRRAVRVAVAPRLESRPAETGFGKHDKVKLVFTQPMDLMSGEIVFSLEGDGVWQDDKTYVFTPKEVRPGQTYSYVIPEGLRSRGGGIVEQQQKYTFATPGVIGIVSFSPQGKELAQARQVIKITFNQAVDRKSAEDHVVVSHGTIISRVWDGNTLLLTGTNFGAQQTVRVNVAPGIRPLFGLENTQGQSYSFTTEIPVKKLAIPMYYQQYAQSCEAASLRMALSYRGIQDSDWNILQKFGYYPRSLDKEKNEWDDPQQQFVGDVRGSQGAGTGWGVYAEPVARAARSYGRGAIPQYGVSASFVARNIYQGNPVILWGVWNESATQKSWKAPDGRTVSGPVPMHVRLVVGVKGSADNPVGFYIHDPITGPTYWTANYMVYNTQRAGAADQAVAIQ